MYCMVWYHHFPSEIVYSVYLFNVLYGVLLLYNPARLYIQGVSICCSFVNWTHRDPRLRKNEKAGFFFYGYQERGLVLCTWKVRTWMTYKWPSKSIGPWSQFHDVFFSPWYDEDFFKAERAELVILNSSTPSVSLDDPSSFLKLLDSSKLLSGRWRNCGTGDAGMDATFCHGQWCWWQMSTS